MSNPAKTPEEIEDVLASIRRLVSDEPAVQARQTPTSEAPQAEPPSVERLVLTPSLRVTEPDATIEDGAAHHGEAQVAEGEAVNVFEDVDASEEDVDEVEHGEVETHADAPDVDGMDADADRSDTERDDAEFDDTESALLTALALNSATEDHFVSVDGQPDQSDWQPEDRLAAYDAVGPVSDEDTSIEAQQSETGENAPEAAASDPAEELEDSVEEEVAQNDVSEDDVASEADVADLIRLDGGVLEGAEFESDTGDENWPGENAEAALLSLVARRDPPTPENADDDEAPAGDGAEAETDANENAVSERPDTLARAVEVVASAEETFADEVMAGVETSADEQIDVLEADAGESAAPVAPIFSRRPRQPAEDEAKSVAEPAEASDDLDDDTSLWAAPEELDGALDEEALREIIVDVVREELQGVLGQRITRNVRKMVRREIRLALAAEDLE